MSKSFSTRMSWFVAVLNRTIDVTPRWQRRVVDHVDVDRVRGPGGAGRAAPANAVAAIGGRRRRTCRRRSRRQGRRTARTVRRTRCGCARRCPIRALPAVLAALARTLSRRGQLRQVERRAVAQRHHVLVGVGVDEREAGDGRPAGLLHLDRADVDGASADPRQPRGGPSVTPAGMSALEPALIAGLPASGSMVGVGPPWSPSAESFGSMPIRLFEVAGSLSAFRSQVAGVAVRVDSSLRRSCSA